MNVLPDTTAEWDEQMDSAIYRSLARSDLAIGSTNWKRVLDHGSPYLEVLKIRAVRQHLIRYFHAIHKLGYAAEPIPANRFVPVPHPEVTTSSYQIYQLHALNPLAGVPRLDPPPPLPAHSGYQISNRVLQKSDEHYYNAWLQCALYHAWNASVAATKIIGSAAGFVDWAGVDPCDKGERIWELMYAIEKFILWYKEQLRLWNGSLVPDLLGLRTG